MHHHVAKLDRRLTQAVTAIPEQFRQFFLIITWLAEVWVIIGLALSMMLAGVLLHTLSFTILAAGGLVVFYSAMLIKRAVRRGRPDTLFVRDSQLKSYSFPSGHAVCAAYFYGLLATAAATNIASPWNAVVVTVLGVAVLLVGISRIYLGAHFPSDVIVGWLYGAAWLAVALVIVS